MGTLGQSPRVTVLIDSYNSLPFIEEAVDSLLQQSRVPDEIIVSDDGSTDGTPEFIETRYADCVRLLRAPQLPGRTVLARQAASFAHAFAHSTGDIVLLLDSDDFFLPTRVERYRDVFAADASLSLVQSPLRRVDRTGNPLPDDGRAWCVMDDLLAEVYRRKDLDVLASTSGMGFSRGFLAEVFPLDVEDGLGVWTDDRLGIRALLHGGVASLPEVSGVWRRHSRSISLSLARERAYLARLGWNRARYFNRYARLVGRPRLRHWSSRHLALRWLKVVAGLALKR